MVLVWFCLFFRRSERMLMFHFDVSLRKPLYKRFPTNRDIGMFTLLLVVIGSANEKGRVGLRFRVRPHRPGRRVPGYRTLPYTPSDREKSTPEMDVSVRLDRFVGTDEEVEYWGLDP